METTFQEVRQRLGFETQRHWSERAIRRTAPALLGLFSLITLLAHQHMAKGADAVRRTAWYEKSHPTFSDALALVRKELWAQETTFCGSSREADTVKVLKAFVERLTDAVCYAAWWPKSSLEEVASPVSSAPFMGTTLPHPLGEAVGFISFLPVISGLAAVRLIVCRDKPGCF